LSRFKSILGLDDTKVTPEERAESERMYGNLKKQGSRSDPGRLGARLKKKV